jgi:hypothetical protein
VTWKAFARDTTDTTQATVSPEFLPKDKTTTTTETTVDDDESTETENDDDNVVDIEDNADSVSSIDTTDTTDNDTLSINNESISMTMIVTQIWSFLKGSTHHS